MNALMKDLGLAYDADRTWENAQKEFEFIKKLNDLDQKAKSGKKEGKHNS